MLGYLTEHCEDIPADFKEKHSLKQGLVVG